MNHLTDLQVPAEWTRILSTVQAIEPRAVLAGGALRDHHNGRPVKDLDIFVPFGANIDGGFSPDMDWEDGIVRVFPEYTSAGRVTSDYGGATVFVNAQFKQSVELRPLSGSNTAPSINLIELPEGREPVMDWERFDFGICQIVYDGQQVSVSSAYLKDYNMRTFTLISRNDIERSMRRWDRLSLKYDGWKLIA